MMKKINELEKAGIDVNKMLQYLLENDRELIVTLNGEKIKITTEEDEILKSIKRDGYLKNPMLFRRWIMAQMFTMLSYGSCFSDEYRDYKGYTGYLHHAKTWKYQLDFLVDEVKRIAKLIVKTDPAVEEYTRICTIPVIRQILREITAKTKKKTWRRYYIDEMEKLTRKAETTKTYIEMYVILVKFRQVMPELRNTKKVPAFVDMYKGIGAYWTCKNMIMFHGCKVDFNGFKFNQHDSMRLLEERARTYFSSPYYFNNTFYDEGGWRMFAFMKKLIADNEFDFKKRMKEVYANK